MLGSTEGFCASLGKKSWALFLQHLCPKNLKEERERERGVLPIFGQSEDPFGLELQKGFSGHVLA